MAGIQQFRPAREGILYESMNIVGVDTRNKASFNHKVFTKVVLYYHFKSKEEILESILIDAQESIKDLTDWAESLPHSSESRYEILQRLSILIDTRWKPMIRFTQANQALMRKISGHKTDVTQFSRIFALVCDPNASPGEIFKSRLAILGIFFAGLAPPAFTTGIEGNLTEIALQVARELITQ